MPNAVLPARSAASAFLPSRTALPLSKQLLSVTLTITEVLFQTHPSFQVLVISIKRIPMRQSSIEDKQDLVQDRGEHTQGETVAAGPLQIGTLRVRQWTVTKGTVGRPCILCRL